MRSKIVAYAFTVTLLVSPIAVGALLVAACGSDRPPVGTPFPSGSADNGSDTTEDDGGGGGLTITILDGGAYCRDVDGAPTLVRDPESQCMCPTTNLSGINVNLPCGFGLCVDSQGAECQFDQTIVRHDDCPTDGGAFPADWLEDCVHDR